MFRSGVIILIISVEEVSHIMKIIKSPWESGSLIKGVSEIFKCEAKEQKRKISQHVIRYIRY